MRQRGPQTGAPFKVPSYLVHPLVVPSIRFRTLVSNVYDAPSLCSVANTCSLALEHNIANLVVSYIRFQCIWQWYGNFANSLLGHPSLDFSLRRFAPCSKISLLPPWAERFAYRSELVVFLACTRNDGFRSSARCPMSSGLRPCGGAGNPHLLRSTSMASLGAGIPAPLARYHTIVICKGNHIKPPATRSPTQRFPSAKNLIKIPNYSFNKNSHILENGLVPPCSILLQQ